MFWTPKYEPTNNYRYYKPLILSGTDYKPMYHPVMPVGLFGKRERFPGHPPKPLAQGIVPSFHMVGLT